VGESADEDRLGIPFRSGDHVEQIVDPVTQIDVRMASGHIEDLGTFGTPDPCMTSRVVLTAVRLHFGDPSPYHRGTDPVAEQFPHQVGGDVQHITGIEIAVESHR